MAILVLLNNFMHDFSAAGWIFGAVLLWMILRKEIPEKAGQNLAADLLKKVLFLMNLSLGGIIIFGAFRVLAYKEYEWSASAGADQITLLIVKHVMLTIVFIVGAVFYLKARKEIKKINDNETE
jgi:uncharacterized membrane protein